MNIFQEAWFWMFTLGTLIFIIGILTYMNHPQDDAPSWSYLAIALGIFMFFLGILILNSNSIFIKDTPTLLDIQNINPVESLYNLRP